MEQRDWDLKGVEGEMGGEREQGDEFCGGEKGGEDSELPIIMMDFLSRDFSTEKMLRSMPRSSSCV